MCVPKQAGPHPIRAGAAPWEECEPNEYSEALSGSSGAERPWASRKVSRELDENLVPGDIRQTPQERHLAQVFSTLRMTAELFHILKRFAADTVSSI